MRSELFRATITLAIVGVCSGCAQTTRHSNTMIFGTNTVVGLKVGANATSVPSIELGYNRQEAVIMPLVANVSANGKLLSPCDVGSKTTAPSGSHNSVHPCLLVGINGSASDSYSVLASFGASFDSSVSQADGKAKGGLAQYFATGMAAQLLALNGGASVVAVGEAAVKAAENRPANGENKALFSNPAAFSRGGSVADSYNSFKSRLIAFVQSINDAKIADQIDLLEVDAGTALGLKAQCSTKDSCAKFIEKNDSFSTQYLNDSTKIENALTARITANGQ